MSGYRLDERIDAAVLVPVFRDGDGELRLVMIRRTAVGIHGGQLAYPGGRPEAIDGSLLETALREAEEEIGLSREQVEVLAPLPPVETITTGYRIFPFLARIRHPGEWRMQPAEVDEVIEVSIRDLLRPEALQIGLERAPNWDAPKQIAYFQVGAGKLWGASYRITRPLLRRLTAGEWATI